MYVEEKTGERRQITIRPIAREELKWCMVLKLSGFLRINTRTQNRSVFVPVAYRNARSSLWKVFSSAISTRYHWKDENVPSLFSAASLTIGKRSGRVFGEISQHLL